MKTDWLSFDWNHTQPAFTVLTKENTINQYDFRKSSNQPLKSVKSSIELTDLLWDRGDNVLFCGGGDSSSGVLTVYTKNL